MTGLTSFTSANGNMLRRPDAPTVYVKFAIFAALARPVQTLFRSLKNVGVVMDALFGAINSHPDELVPTRQRKLPRCASEP